MRRILFILLLIVSCQWSMVNPVSAQVKFGYLSYKTVMQQMPEYEQMQQKLTDLRQKYEQEATRGEKEFQHKFSEFLQGQKDFPENILLKRQAELQTLMEAGIKFRQEAQKLVAKAESEQLESIYERLNDAIRVVGMEMGLAAVLNTDNNQCPFINPALGDDITIPVLRALGLEQEQETVEASEESVEKTAE